MGGVAVPAWMTGGAFKRGPWCFLQPYRGGPLVPPGDPVAT